MAVDVVEHPCGLVPACVRINRNRIVADAHVGSAALKQAERIGFPRVCQRKVPAKPCVVAVALVVAQDVRVGGAV